ncbi:homoserine dehydrogenase [Lactobacillaceae bacterium 24-114]
MQKITIGLLGLGTVGSGVVKLLEEHAPKIEQIAHTHFILKKVVVAHLDKPRNISLPSSTILIDSIDNVVNDPDIDVVIETMGTISRARQAIIQAIHHHKSVITANKDLIAIEGPKLIQLAKQHHVDLFYEASVAGGIPILRILSNSLVTDQITQVTGIINGTANYILSSMINQNIDYQEALQAAQVQGYAEANPTNDVKGIDTANKLSILSQFAFGKSLDPKKLNIHGIDQLMPAQLVSAHQLGYTIKLLAIAKHLGNRLYTFVGPCLLSQSSLLAQVNGVQNAVMINSNALGASLYTGPGAGAKPTANSILSDLIAIANDISNHNCGNAFNNYHQELDRSNLNELPQQYLLTADHALTSPSFQWEECLKGSNYWSGITPMLTEDELKVFLNTLDTSVKYLPINPL